MTEINNPVSEVVVYSPDGTYLRFKFINHVGFDVENNTLVVLVNSARGQILEQFHFEEGENYWIGYQNGEKFLMCKKCNRRTFNSNDIDRKYCPGDGFLEV